MINRFSQRTKRLLLARSATCMQKYGRVKASGVQASNTMGALSVHIGWREQACVYGMMSLASTFRRVIP